MNIKTFLSCAAILFQSDSPRSILIQGGHGIGKSALAKKLGRTHKAKSTGKYLKLIDKRLAQLTEGDIVGLPFKDDSRRTTEWFAPDWIRMACEEPCLLFLDEANRATGEVMQASFQLVLDRCIGDNVLHPDTRIVMAVNNDSRLYQVNDMDPAYRDRFWQCDLTPTVEEWLEWARDTSPEGGNIHETICNFITEHDTCLDPSPAANPGDKQPSRRSWEGFNMAARLGGFIDSDWPTLGTEKQTIFQQIANGFLGNDVSTTFIGVFKQLEKQVSADDLVNDWDKVADRVKAMSQTEHNGLIDRLVTWMKVPENSFTDAQAKNVGNFVQVLPGELAVAFWQSAAKEHSQTVNNIKLMHKYINKHIVAAIGTLPKAAAT